METTKELNEGRADTDYKKEDVIKTILRIWQTDFPSLRLTQLLVSASHEHSGGDIFYLEDTELRDLIIKYRDRYAKH